MDASGGHWLTNGRRWGDGATRVAATFALRRPPVALALAVTVGAEGALVAPSHLATMLGVALAVIAAASWALVVSDPRLEARPGWALLAIAVVFAIGLAVPPRGSHDLWSYVMYGRTVGVHHASPYVHAPRDYPHDPFLHLVARGWRGTKSVYGPLFTGVSVVLTKVAGGSVLRARLAFQGLAVLGVVAVLGLLWTETRSVRVLAFVGLHPVIVVAIVNGAHNDGLVGLAVVAGAVLVGRRRFTAAGVVVGLGMLVKASTGFGILGLAVWLLARDRRQTARFLCAAALTTVVGYLPAGSAALGAVAGSASRTSRTTVWSPISRALHEPVGAAALLVVVLLGLLGALRLRAQAQPSLAAAGAIAAYLFAGAYVLSWYPAWALPSAALARRSWIAMLVAAHAAFLVAVYQLPEHVVAGSAAAIVGGIAAGIGAWGFLVVFIAVLFRRRPSPAGGGARFGASMGPP